MIYGERVRQARKLRRLTQKNLAELVGASQVAISEIETGAVQPNSQIREAIASATGFSVQFFERPPGPEVPLGSLFFRARAIKQVDVDEAHAWTELGYECVHELSHRLRVHTVSLPNLSSEQPEKAAQMTRSLLGLAPDRPIRNLMHTLEQFGILVLALPMRLEGRDAWSAWVGANPRYPLIVVSSGSLGGRLRFTVSHELDHLLAPDFRGSSDLAEKSANRFAAEFLLPAAGIRDELSVPMTLGGISPIARRWGVSPQFVAMRAMQLGRISQRRAQQVFQQLAAQGYARQEPPDATIRVEKPRLFKRFAEMVYGIPVDPRKLARDFSLPTTMASAIVSAHAERSELVATVPDDGTTPGKVLSFRLTR